LIPTDWGPYPWVNLQEKSIFYRCWGFESGSAFRQLHLDSGSRRVKKNHKKCRNFMFWSAKFFYGWWLLV
jgi:hypothetical protein